MLHFPECPHPLPALPCSPLPAGRQQGPVRRGLFAGQACGSLPPYIPSLVFLLSLQCGHTRSSQAVWKAGRWGNVTMLIKSHKTIHILWPNNSTLGNCFQGNYLKEEKDTCTVSSYVIYNTQKVEANAMTQNRKIIK